MNYIVKICVHRYSRQTVCRMRDIFEKSKRVSSSNPLKMNFEIDDTIDDQLLNC